MGGGSYSRDDYDDRAKYRTTTSTPVFAHTAAIHSGKAAAAVHPSLNPLNVKFREARDSDAHPVTVPIAILLDTTGSMATVPEIIESKLNTLMGHFLEDKASGKKYLGDGYPSVMVSAVDDYCAMGGEGALQVGQFESDMKIDEMLENLWLTKNGGGTYEESYELGVYFMARHTVHDHMEKRGRKGYLFIIGDEHPYNAVAKNQIKEIIGDTVQADILFPDILDEARELYHVFYVLPNLTNHYSDKSLYSWWVERLGQQNVLRLEDPHKVCELIVAAVAICEQHVGIKELETDGVIAGLTEALVPLSKSAGSLTSYSATGLPKIAGGGGVERL